MIFFMIFMGIVHLIFFMMFMGIVHVPAGGSGDVQRDAPDDGPGYNQDLSSFLHFYDSFFADTTMLRYEWVMRWRRHVHSPPVDALAIPHDREVPVPDCWILEPRYPVSVIPYAPGAAA
jgi:hypothetical protein